MKKHFVRNSERPICSNLQSFSGESNKCIFLRKNTDGWYVCYAYGFRQHISGVNGICKISGWKVFYDHEMLNSVKNLKFNFCFYRFFAPIFIVLSVLGVSSLIRIVMKLWH